VLEKKALQALQSDISTAISQYMKNSHPKFQNIIPLHTNIFDYNIFVLCSFNYKQSFMED
jgi:hypothetical protein